MRVWIDLTNSPHVLVMRPVIELPASRRPRGAASPRATSPRRSSCANASGSSTRRSAATAASGSPPRPSASPRARRRSCAGRAVTGARAPRRSTSRSGTAPTTSAWPRRCCGSRARRCSTTSGRRSSTTSTAGWRARSSCPRRSPPSASTATARRGKMRRYPGLKEEYYLADFEPDAGGPATSSASTAGAPDRRRAHAARGLALPPLRERPLRAPADAPGAAACRRAAVQPVVLPRVASQRGGAGRCPASSCPSTRSTPSR